MIRFSLFAIVLPLGLPAAAQERLGIMLQIEPDAAARLQEMGEWVTVSAWYYGEPSGPDIPVDEMGLVYLGREELTVYPVSQWVELGGGLAAMPSDRVSEAMVNVNVHTARVAHENNLLDCGIVEASVAEVAAASGSADAAILCGWLGG